MHHQYKGEGGEGLLVVLERSVIGLYAARDHFKEGEGKGKIVIGFFSPFFNAMTSRRLLYQPVTTSTTTTSYDLSL